MSVIPDIPGALVPRCSEQDTWLKNYVSSLCDLGHPKFPGSQPVSFSLKDLDKLEKEDYWVCEKSDGVRVLFLLVTNLDTNEQAAFLIDRHNDYRELQGFFFPHHERPEMPLRSSLLDGELVVDVDPKTKQQTLRYLAFDCLVVDNQNVMTKTLDKRYGRLKEWFYKPYSRMMRDHPHMAAGAPFEIRVKEIAFSYHVEQVFAGIPALQHGNDGLIYTRVNSPYVPATDPNIMKWKPPSENSIDFKLVLRFPPSKRNPSQPDFLAKPFFALHVWCGGEGESARYEHYDELHVTDSEWEKMKLSGEQIDDRIVEVHWDPSLNHWRMMRFRDDKPHGNHKSVVDKIIQSIADGVEKDGLLARSNDIRVAWKARIGQPNAPPPPHHPQPQAPPQRQWVVPKAEVKYGPLASGPWSRVAGPAVVAGMKR